MERSFFAFSKGSLQYDKSTHLDDLHRPLAIRMLTRLELYETETAMDKVKDDRELNTNCARESRGQGHQCLSELIQVVGRMTAGVGLQG